MSRPDRRDDTPLPPWGAFPLVELCALAAIVLGVAGLIVRDGMLLTLAMVLGSIAGLEVAIREHFAGYRSHTLVLAGTAAVVTLALLFFAGVARAALPIVAVALLAVGIVGFRALFKRRSGGVAVRVR